VQIRGILALSQLIPADLIFISTYPCTDSDPSPPIPTSSLIHPHPSPQIFFVIEPKVVIIKVTVVAMVLFTTFHNSAVAYYFGL